MKTTAFNTDLDRLAERRVSARMGWYTHATVYAMVISGLALLGWWQGRFWPIAPALPWAGAWGWRCMGWRCSSGAAARGCGPTWCSASASGSKSACEQLECLIMNTPSRRLFRRLLAGIFSAVSGVIAGTASAQVGMQQMQVGAMTVTLVYPTTSVASTQALGPFSIDVALGAPALEKRQRLIVMSHGSGGSPLADHALAAAFARAGFVVAQPLHEGNNFRDQRLAGPETFIKRPGEVTQIIDALANDPRWSSRLALDKVGVHGMSAGGVTGLSLAGAQWRRIDLVRHCKAHEQADAGFCFAGANDAAARAGRQAAFDSADKTPEADLPAELTAWHGGRSPGSQQADPRPDARIAAVSLAVPVAAIFNAERLARIRIPVGVVGAQRDEVLVPRFHSARVLALCEACTLLADLPGAGHFDVLWPWPESVAREVAEEQVRGGLPVPGFDASLREAAQAKMVAFHRQHLLPIP